MKFLKVVLLGISLFIGVTGVANEVERVEKIYKRLADRVGGTKNFEAGLYLMLYGNPFRKARGFEERLEAFQDLKRRYAISDEGKVCKMPALDQFFDSMGNKRVRVIDLWAKKGLRAKRSQRRENLIGKIERLRSGN